MLKLLALAFTLVSLTAFAAPKGKVFFVSPKDGATVGPTVHVKIGAEGFKLRPAGEDINDQATGHHHIIVDGGPVPAGEIIPADTTHLHYGKAQTEADIHLPPGKHKLTLQLADGAHRSYGPELSSSIEITVK